MKQVTALFVAVLISFTVLAPFAARAQLGSSSYQPSSVQGELTTLYTQLIQVLEQLLIQLTTAAHNRTLSPTSQTPSAQITDTKTSPSDLQKSGGTASGTNTATSTAVSTVTGPISPMTPTPPAGCPFNFVDCPVGYVQQLGGEDANGCDLPPQCVPAPTQPSPITASTQCGPGWVLVPGNSSLGTSDFCIMKFEAQYPGGSSGWQGFINAMKDEGSSASPEYVVPSSYLSVAPVSGYSSSAQDVNVPWTYITQQQAAAACKSIGAHLTTMTETETLNRNLEEQPRNWLSGTVGNQCMYGGHVDLDPDEVLPAPTGSDAQNNPYQFMPDDEAAAAAGKSSCPFLVSDYSTAVPAIHDVGLLARRTLYLSTGAVIWDWSGNAAEWIADTCPNNRNGPGALYTFNSQGGNGYGYFDFNPADNPIASANSSYTEWTQAYLEDYEEKMLGPFDPSVPGSGSFNSQQGVGMYYGCYQNGDAIYRGGSAYQGQAAGVFQVHMLHTTTFNHPFVGFRCVKGAAPAAEVTIQPQTTYVAQGGGTTLWWNASNIVPNSCNIYIKYPTAASFVQFGVPNQISNAGAPTGVLSTAGSYTYKITCVANDGSTQTAQTTVIVPARASPATSTPSSTPSPFSHPDVLNNGNPYQGAAPLAVTFTGTVNGSGSCNASAYTLSFGDTVQEINIPSGYCAPENFSYTHQYLKPGFYDAALFQGYSRTGTGRRLYDHQYNSHQCDRFCVLSARYFTEYQRPNGNHTRGTGECVHHRVGLHEMFVVFGFDIHGRSGSTPAMERITRQGPGPSPRH